jgi:RNA polymerase sigma factor (sigma-70 family)
LRPEPSFRLDLLEPGNVDSTDAKRLGNRDLVERLLDAGPEDGVWGEFLSRFQGRIRLVVLRSFQTEAERNPGLDTGSLHESVLDLSQEVFLKLLESNRRALTRFRGKSEHSLHTYLHIIAVNLVRDHFKKLRAQKTPRASASISSLVQQELESDGPSYDQALVSDGPGPERFVASQELRDRMGAAIDRASPQASTGPRDRLIFRLYFVEGLTVGEIGAIPSIGLTESGIEKCIRRMREALREELQESRQGGKSPSISS